MKEEFVFVDYLKEYMTKLVTRYVKDHRDSLPGEFVGIPDEKLIYAITNETVPILRGIENTAILAGVEQFASLIRYSQKRGGR